MLYIYQILVCGGTGCEATKGVEIFKRLKKEIADRGLEDKIKIIKTGCFGFCEQGPVIKVVPDHIYYVKVKPEDVAEIIEEHIVHGNVVQRLLYSGSEKRSDKVLPPHRTEQPYQKDEIDFYKRQERIVLRNFGYIDLEDITEYLGADGYVALEKVLSGMAPEKVINELKISGLRGRGGAGFPTWMKWDFCRKQTGDIKYIVCNADEGDPGAFMDRSVLEGDPHSLIEGMTIGAYAIGAVKGYIYVRVEYGLAIERIKKAIAQAYEFRLLGKNILGSSFSFDLEIRLGAGAFVCGEETALLASVEGKRGTPRPRPPYPSVSGLFGKPTVINNVETFANISTIINKGGKWFSEIGTETSKGTKVFCLTGKVKNSALVEVPMGTTLSEIVYGIGGGVANNKKLKAVQTGGPSGGVIPVEYLHTPVDYESLNELGSIMGSGGMIVMDEDDCMIDIAKFYLGFCVEESCGKCAACRIGGYQMLAILNKISEGDGEMEDIEKLKKLSIAMSKGSLCGLGQSAANPVISTLKYYMDEYEAHIRDKKCPAGKCKSLLHFEIIQDKCKRCRLCVKSCPTAAIAGDPKTGFVIETEKCIKCGACVQVCPFNAIGGK